MKARVLLFSYLICLAVCAVATPVTRTLEVDGVKRTALVYPGADAARTPSPVVLAFHGFGGNAEQMAGMTRLHEEWPEATVVYPLGLTKFSVNQQRRVPAWQAGPYVDKQRDVLFVDALLADLEATYRVDSRRIYVTGMSNGAIFTYVLLMMRPQLFAAFAPVAGAGLFVKDALTPRPVLIIHGKDDKVVSLQSAEKTRDILRALNGCGNREVEWAPGYNSYDPCESGFPIIWREFHGGHIWPVEASEKIVAFFKEHLLPEPQVDHP